MTYKYIEDISLADVCFVAEAKTLEKLLEECGLATTNVMVKDMKSVKKKMKKKFTVEADSIDLLIAKFVGEIIFYKDADLLLFSDYDVKVKEIISGKVKAKNAATGQNENKNAEKTTYKLTCTASGEKLDMKKHELLVDVKAFTWHLFEVQHDRKGWRTRVVLDI